MKTFVVLQPPGTSDPAETRFIRDGFSFVALVVPFLWLAWHRLWIEAALVFALALLVGALAEAWPWAAGLGVLTLLAAVFVALEGGALRVAALKRKGWRELGTVAGARLEDAEMRWFADRPGSEPVPPARLVTALRRKAPASPALGLFSYPGKT